MVEGDIAVHRSVVDEDVHRSENVGDAVSEFLTAAVGVGEIDGDDEALAADGLDAVTCLFQAGDGPRGDRHLGAFGREAEGDGGPGPSLARAGDQGHLLLTRALRHR